MLRLEDSDTELEVDEDINDDFNDETIREDDSAFSSSPGEEPFSFKLTKTLLVPRKFSAPTYWMPCSARAAETAPDVVAHLEAAAQHSRAEIWAFFKEWVLPLEPNWMARRSETYKVEVKYHGVQLSTCPHDNADTCVDIIHKTAQGSIKPRFIHTVGTHKHDRKVYDLVLCSATPHTRGAGPRPPLSLRLLKGHFVVYRGNLFYAYDTQLSCGCDNSAQAHGLVGAQHCAEHKDAVLHAVMRRLMSMRDYPDPAATDLDLMYVSDFCSPTIKTFTLLSAMLKRFNDHGVPRESMLPWLVNPYRGTRAAPLPGRAPLYLRVPAAPIGPAPDRAPVDGPSEEAAATLQHVFTPGDVHLAPAQAAVLNDLLGRLELVHGPPGTGKSTCIRAVVRHCVPVAADDVVLVVAVQNKAVDVMVHMLAQHMVIGDTLDCSPLMVVGSPHNPNLGLHAREYLCDTTITRLPQYELVEKLIAQHAHARSSEEKVELWKKAMAERKALQEGVVASARVVLCTITEIIKILTQPLYQPLIARVKTIILDEAGNVTEDVMPTLAALPCVQRLVCFGDARQLPPFTHISDSPCLGFLERAEAVLAVARVDMPMLTTQFRMHPDIATLVSHTFYDGRIVTDTATARSRVTAAGPAGAVRLSGLYWLDYNSHHAHLLERGQPPVERNVFEGEQEITRSTYNMTEAHHVVELIALLAQGDHLAGRGTVSVITFYRAQIGKIHMLLEKYEERMKHTAEGRRVTAARRESRLCVMTVDASQGSEADIVILSCVRANDEAKCGFLASREGPHRLCVALSRARNALVIVGHRRTLCAASIAGLCALPLTTDADTMWRADTPLRATRTKKKKASQAAVASSPAAWQPPRAPGRVSASPTSSVGGADELTEAFPPLSVTLATRQKRGVVAAPAPPPFAAGDRAALAPAGPKLAVWATGVTSAASLPT